MVELGLALFLIGTALIGEGRKRMRPLSERSQEERKRAAERRGWRFSHGAMGEMTALRRRGGSILVPYRRLGDPWSEMLDAVDRFEANERAFS